MNKNLNRRSFIKITTGMGVCGLISAFNPTIVCAMQNSLNKDKRKREIYIKSDLMTVLKMVTF